MCCQLQLEGDAARQLQEVLLQPLLLQLLQGGRRRRAMDLDDHNPPAQSGVSMQQAGST
jgi:hypothetical protein